MKNIFFTCFAEGGMSNIHDFIFEYFLFGRLDFFEIKNNNKLTKLMKIRLSALYYVLHIFF